MVTRINPPRFTLFKDNGRQQAFYVVNEYELVQFQSDILVGKYNYKHWSVTDRLDKKVNFDISGSLTGDLFNYGLMDTIKKY